MCATRSFVEENEGVYDRLVYSTLETVALLDPRVVQELVPDLSLSLRTTEHKRGQGRNAALRCVCVCVCVCVYICV